MKTNFRFLDMDEWQGIYHNEKLIIECRNQDVGEIVMRMFAQYPCRNRILKRLYIPGNSRCPEKWTEEMEKEAK
jgi:hypothetical protein